MFYNMLDRKNLYILWIFFNFASNFVVKLTKMIFYYFFYTTKIAVYYSKINQNFLVVSKFKNKIRWQKTTKTI